MAVVDGGVTPRIPKPARPTGESSAGARVRIWCVGGEDSELRLPFIRALRDGGFDVVALGSGSPEPFIAAGVPYRSYRLDRFGNIVSNIAAIGELARQMRLDRPSIVQTFDTKPGLIAPVAARFATRPAVVRTINGLGYAFSTTAHAGKLLQFAYGTLQRRVAPLTNVTIFQNSDDYSIFRERGWISGGSELIPGSGIDVAGFRAAIPCGRELAELRRRLGLEGRRVVTTVTRLTRQKGVPTLLAAAELLAPRGDTVFLLAGPRQEEGPLAIPQALLDRYAGIVRYIGKRSDVPALLGLTDIFVLPTEYREGIPRVLLEAGLAGRPIVTTSLPGCTDVVRHGWNGLVVPPAQPAELATAIAFLLDHPAIGQDMGERGRMLVAERFALDRVAAAYVRVYERVLAASAAGGPGAAGRGRRFQSVRTHAAAFEK